MHLLTWHGTLVCQPNANGIMKHASLKAEPNAHALDVDATSLIDRGNLRHAALGAVRVIAAVRSPAVWLRRDGQFMCADAGNGCVAFNRSKAAQWETFLPIEHGRVQDLQQILRNPWIVRESRVIIRRSTIILGSDFTLTLADATLDLRAERPFEVLTRGQDGLPRSFLFLKHGKEIELLIAEPRSSLLLETALWPVRSRRTAEILSIATHRHLLGVEPTQDVFERDTSFLESNRGPAGLGDLLEQLTPNPDRIFEKTPVCSLPEASIPLEPRCRVVSLGTACITALVLRRVGLEGPSMPFNWLTTNPDMINHCLASNFSRLLDRTQYQSVTGKGAADEPEDGCEHLFYKEKFGLGRVFNHNDPTREADYRYTEMTVERMRDLLASDEPKIFVQCRGTDPHTGRHFRQTASLLDRLTKGARLLQFEVMPPEPELATPLLDIAKRQGAHILYRLRPTSQMGGEYFEADIDTDFLGWTIANTASWPARSKAARASARLALQSAIARFGYERPEPASASTETVILETGEKSLRTFLAAAKLPRRYKFGLIQRGQLAADVHHEAVAVEIASGIVTLRIDPETKSPWTMLERSLSLIFQLDAMFVAGPVPDTRFLAEVGDAGYLNGVAFCSKALAGCLVPDSDFISSGGYADVRAMARLNTVPWPARAAMAFWRGSTTGQQRRPPPATSKEDDFSWLPRLDLCRRARDSELAPYYDVGISRICQIDDADVVARIEAGFLCRSPVPRTAFFGYKAIIVIDGNSNAWSALFCALLTGSCVLLVESPGGFRQWYYDRLQAWTHYIPVSSDLDDLDRAVAWMLAHDAKAQEIGDAGKRFAEEITFEGPSQIHRRGSGLGWQDLERDPVAATARGYYFHGCDSNLSRRIRGEIISPILELWVAYVYT